VRRFLILVVLAALAAALPASAARKGTSVSLVAYSTPTVAFGKIVPAFQKTAAGKDVQVQQSYAASEVQAKAVIAGLSADVVDLSLQPDLQRLVDAKLVPANWNKNAYDGFVTKSVVVFVLRNGNPKHIRTWDDLAKPGVQVVTPNPFTSGGARWNVMAAYGAQLRAGKTPRQATAYLDKLFHNVVSQDTSARNALQTFLSGRGDVLLTYENEAILAQQQNKPVYYLIPKATIQIENPLALTTSGNSKAEARAFYKFLYTPAAQRLFAETGYRPVVPSVAKQFAKRFPPRPQLFEIGYVGGWSKVAKQFFDPDKGVMAKIERGLGVPTG
jgi:sulfate/thiosulfate transport system substrate-binding protein